MSDKPEVNSLDRFRKQPGRLVLETYDHCEVPAGCGGVVFRWRRAERDHEFAVSVFSPAQATVWVDGEEMISRRTDLTAGPHVLALRLENAPLSGPLLMAVGAVRVYTGQGRGAHWPVGLRTAPDGAWACRLTEPGDGWLTGAGEGWAPMVQTELPPEPGRSEAGRWAFRRCVDEGAACLGVPGTAEGVGTVWARAPFTLAPREEM